MLINYHYLHLLIDPKLDPLPILLLNYFLYYHFQTNVNSFTEYIIILIEKDIISHFIEYYNICKFPLFLFQYIN